MRVNFPRNRPLPASRGVILLLALVFMLLLAIVAGTVMRTAILQLHMTGNDQFLEEAFHQAQAIATELSLDSANFSLAMDVGDSNCPAGTHGLGCDRYQLQIPASAGTSTGTEVNYRVTRQEPLLGRGFPLRESQETVSSSASDGAAIFEISVGIDGSGKRLGSAHIAQGIAVRVSVVR